ncbi:urea carboxylase-associated family protein [Aurantiacibacter hainanensis]|uniref:urea carboxylase-associated family protein n=1 Tax=Aurantiacibacter hainanensis TaxID=3076114 RepID=UPI0030C777EF
MSDDAIRIEPRSGTSFVLREGQRLEVIDLEGGQVSDLLAFGLADRGEALSNGRTFDYEETIKLTAGNTLWSNRSNPMLDIVADDVGMHDFLLTPCSKDTFRHFYPDKPVHRGCFGNLAAALAEYDITEDDLPCAFNVFMNVPVDGQSGRLSVEPPVSKAGDTLTLQARMDLVIGLTACSAYASNGGTFKPIGYRIS